MFCSSCGTRYEPGEAFCGECGQSLPALTNPGLPQMAGFSAALGRVPRMAWAIGLGAIVIALIAVPIVRSARNDAPAEALERYIEALRTKRYDDALAMVDPDKVAKLSSMPAEKRNMALASSLKKNSKAYCGEAGVTGYSVKTSSLVDDRALVVTTYECGDGTTKSDEVNPTAVIQLNGQWYISD